MYKERNGKNKQLKILKIYYKKKFKRVDIKDRKIFERGKISLVEV